MQQRKTRKRKVHTESAQVLTAGSIVRIEQPKSDRQPKPNVAVVVAQEINPVTGFVGFLREHSVVGLAVGFAIATQAQALVKQLITSFIDPLYALLFSGEKLSTKSSTLHFHGREQAFGWGAFMYTLLDFLFVLLAIYLIVKFFKLDRLAKAKDEKKDK
ncbi:MAG: MscL family protein [Patescibacteria group bacterium]|nr:MscL family protein [Patescibacteria group bacterium]